MNADHTPASVEILLVEDSPGDVRLTREAFRGANRSVASLVATDGLEAPGQVAQRMQNRVQPIAHVVPLIVPGEERASCHTASRKYAYRQFEFRSLSIATWI